MSYPPLSTEAITELQGHEPQVESCRTYKHWWGVTPTPEGDRINLMLPHSYIASMTGIAYEESVRIISRLRKQHQYIQYLRGGKIIVTNHERLEDLA